MPARQLRNLPADWPAQAGFAQDDLFYALPAQVIANAAPGGFDFGKLGHDG